MANLLSGNILKIIALVTMTVDHVGMELFPQYPIFRIIGRLSMPIYAYMIAEGCRYTHDRSRYLLRLLGLGLLCQLGYFLFSGSLYMCILITFTLSVLLIELYENYDRWLFFLGLVTVYLLCRVMPDLLPGTDYAIDYGLWGVVLPVFIYFGKTAKQRLGYAALGMVLLALNSYYLQWYSLLALPILALYSGKRGKANIGKLFYWYYPVHLVIIAAVKALIR